MTAAHTPGPWFARKDPNSLDNDDWCVGTGPENIDKVAVCSAWDAPLIAAAPELLEALEEAENALADYIPTIERTGASLNYGHSVLNKARAAIAKATGAACIRGRQVPYED